MGPLSAYLLWSSTTENIIWIRKYIILVLVCVIYHHPFLSFPHLFLPFFLVTLFLLSFLSILVLPLFSVQGGILCFLFILQGKWQITQFESKTVLKGAMPNFCVRACMCAWVRLCVCVRKGSLKSVKESMCTKKRARWVIPDETLDPTAYKQLNYHTRTSWSVSCFVLFPKPTIIVSHWKKADVRHKCSHDTHKSTVLLPLQWDLKSLYIRTRLFWHISWRHCLSK